MRKPITVLEIIDRVLELPRHERIYLTCGDNYGIRSKAEYYLKFEKAFAYECLGYSTDMIDGEESLTIVVSYEDYNKFKDLVVKE